MKKFILPSENGYPISCMEWRPVCRQAEEDSSGAGQSIFAEEQNPDIVICLHGFAGDKYSSVIKAVAEALVRHGKRVVTFDWPAHGDSQAGPEMLTVENCLRDLHTVLTYYRAYMKKAANDIAVNERLEADGYAGQVERGKISCFATSFGGYLAMLYREKYPQDFNQYMLRSPALRMPEILLSFMTEEQLAAFDRGEKLNFGFEKELWLDKSFYDDLCRYDAFGGMPEGTNESAPVCINESKLFLQKSKEEELADSACRRDEKLAGKVFIIHGDLDDTVPVADSMDFARRHQIRMYIVKGADHRYKNPGELEQIVEQAEKFLGV